MPVSTPLSDSQKPPFGPLTLDPGNPLGLVGAWVLNEMGSQVINDAALGGDTPALSGGATWGSTTMGPALQFAGEAASQATSSAFRAAPTSKVFSFAVWVGVTSYTSLANVFMFGEPTTGAAGGRMRGLLQYSTVVYFWGDNADWGTAQAWDTTGAIHQIVFTGDGSTLRFYYDGVFQASLANPANLVALATADTNVTFGGKHSSGTTSITGKIPLAYVANKAWNAGEVAQLYAEPFFMWQTRPLRRVAVPVATSSFPLPQPWIARPWNRPILAR